MKATTLGLVAVSFLGGVGFGLTGPLTAARDGLGNLLAHESAPLERADRIVATFNSGVHGAFVPADFRWPAKATATIETLCGAEKESVVKGPAIVLQHL